MLKNKAAQDLQTTHNGEQMPPQRSPWRVLITVLTAVATSAILVGAPTNSVQAVTSQVRTVTISGDCNGLATSDWQTVTGVDPTLNAGNTNTLFLIAANKIQPGDTLKIINNCDSGVTLYLSKPWYLSFVGNPVFSSGSWSGTEGAIPNQGHGQVVLGTTNQTEMMFADFVKSDPPADGTRANVFSAWNYGPFIFEQAELSINGVARDSFTLVSNQAISPISLSVTQSYADLGGPPATAVEVRGGNYFPLSGTPEPSALPPGLSFSCLTPILDNTEVIGCTLPATIVGTPTQVGSYTVNFVFNRADGGLGKIAKSVIFSVASTPTVTSVSPTSGSTTGGTAITITGTNFAAGATVTLGGATCTNVTVVSATQITCTTPAGSAGTASVVVTSSGLLNNANTLFTYNTPAVAPTTTTIAPAPPTTTVAPAVSAPTTNTTLSDAPQLVTSENQALLVSAPGEATAIVNGKTVAVETIKVDAAATTKELEATGQNIVNILSALTPSGSVNPIKLVKTSDGPVLTGLIVNPYDPTEKLDAPVESVTLVKAGESAVLISAVNITNLPAPIAASGSIEVTRGGVLAARSYGLPSLETGEIVLMSTPRLLQKFIVDKDGSYSGQVVLPRNISIGKHTVVMATKNVKVSLGITLVATKLMFRTKSSIGTRLFEKRAGVKKVGGAVTVTGAGRCKAKLGKITMNKKPGKCFITVKQAAKGTNRAVYSRFTVTVVKKLPRAQKK
jgi:hypothetical protein